MAQLTAFGMIAADFTGFPAKRAGQVAMACRFATMTAGRVWSPTLCLTDPVFVLGDDAINSDIAVFTSIGAIVSAA